MSDACCTAAPAMSAAAGMFVVGSIYTLPDDQDTLSSHLGAERGFR